MSDRVVLDGELSLSNVLDGQGGVYSRYDWRGYSAYEIAVQHGYTGTEEEWLSSLQGATGPQGEKGDQGVQGIQGPKGDPGDDYTLTEQDKQEIAGMVDTPVNDVQINGTSILQDGVAEIPVASASATGVVGINSWFGININNSGQLYLMPSSLSIIKAGSRDYYSIPPNMQHYSTFYGLAKVAGYDEKNSTLPVGEYSEEAKVAIQKMLGIYQAPWELIREDTFTNETEADHIIETDANGESFELTDVVIELIVPLHDEDTIHSDFCRVYLRNQNNTVCTVYLGNSTSKTITANSAVNMAMASVTQDNGLMRIEINQWGTRTQRSSKQILLEENLGTSAPYRINSTPFDSVKIGKVTGLMKYRIFGRRKWRYHV